MSKVQQAIYLATVRLHVMDLTDEVMRTHWINDETFVATILGYHDKQFTAEAVAHALVDAYRAVMREDDGGYWNTEAARLREKEAVGN